MSVLHLRDIRKTYNVTPPVPVLHGVDLDVDAGEKVAILGYSGAGKSTLLNIMGLLDVPTSGTYELAGHETQSLSGRRRDHLRSDVLGFVFQDYHVLGHRTVAENLDLKLSITGVPHAERESAINDALSNVGLLERKHSLSRLLSGGEKQRLAIARAIITHPQVLLADEPTGNLDSLNAKIVLDLFDQQAAKGVAIVVITHDDRLARWADRVVHLRDGKIDSMESGQ
ncbi:putative ABC transport system ATP-binding protein [Arcanobacterium pluranimalium]|uniref:ABC transporter ATP-binding protein n=1 Tax=Arcanobacterium pluranimalium TaxID=108028 RepID=UPI00195E20A7|nr:ABC transporter ATP-binding protein [Arcanobacterium pluranimalium]MBM7824335.1 putative ABC transport system ATP-binding protein [Arcanobacterium pluranimalium]